MRLLKILLVFLIASAAGEGASAQTAKELKTKSGNSVVMVNLINVKPDCSSAPGPVAVPVVLGKPSNGLVQMLIIVTDVPASGTCPARKIPSIAVVYTPNKNFAGVDTVQIEVDAGNRATVFSYRITVESPAQPL